MTTRVRSYRHSTPHRFAVIGWVVIVVVCLALATPVFAFASRSVHDVVVPTRGAAASTAACPKGEHVGFGGMAGDIRVTFPQFRVVPEGMRVTANNKWTVYGKGYSPSGRLRSVAYCVRGSVGPRVVSKSAAVGRRTVGTVIATCPPGTVVVAGGYNAGTGVRNQEALRRFERVGTRQWLVTMRVDGLSTTVTAYAYCSSGAAPRLASSTVKLTRFGNVSARASCPKGTSLVGGGLTTSSLYGSFDVSSLTASTSTQWVVKAGNAGNSGSFTAEAYCR
jgi:hypothetical protein